MNLRNRVQLIGNLRANPTIKVFGKKKLARFSVSTTDILKINNNLIKDTQFHIVVAWDELAEMVEKNLSSGTEVVVDGRLVSRSYDDAQGIKRYITEVIVESLLFNNNHLESERAGNKIA